MRIIASFIISIFLLAPSIAGAQTPGWWIIIASPKMDAPQGGIDESYRKAKQCGFEAYHDFSEKFMNFKPGYNVVVLVHPYQTQKAATIDLKRVRKCVPDAYIKYGSYAGE